MVLKNLFGALIGMMLLAWSGLVFADESRPDEYRPDELLGLDLSKAVLSPKPLGPPSQFVPVGVQAKTDLASERIKRPKVRVAHLDNEKHRVIARTRLARRRQSLLDAQAFDTRVQVWPCKSGGICKWKPQAN